MQYFYIHGFGTTGAGSQKFKKIKQFAQAKNQKAFALEWNEFQTEIVTELIRQIETQIDWNQPVCVIGSSTGGNFAYQLWDYFQQKTPHFSLILINPLLNIVQRKIEVTNFPLQLVDQLKNPSEKVKNALVLLGKEDEILDYEYTYNVLHPNNKIVIGNNWNHTLSNLETDAFLALITSFTEKKCNSSSTNSEKFTTDKPI